MEGKVQAVHHWQLQECGARWVTLLKVVMKLMRKRRYQQFHTPTIYCTFVLYQKKGRSSNLLRRLSMRKDKRKAYMSEIYESEDSYR